MAIEAYAYTLGGVVTKHPVTKTELTLIKGDTLSLLVNGGERDCLVLFKGQTYWVNLSSPAPFASSGWDGRCRAEVMQWWIKVNNGWAEVDGNRLRGKLVMWND